jgi:predicted DNA-binding transcriptional regulator YafY
MNNLLNRSLKEQSPLEIIYMAVPDRTTKRKVIIKKVNVDSVTAYCFLRKQLRTFRIDCILAVYPLKKHRQHYFSAKRG